MSYQTFQTQRTGSQQPLSHGATATRGPNFSHAVEPGQSSAESAIQRAEQALEQMSGKFEAWMHAEAMSLRTARDDAREAGMSQEAVDKLFHVSHDLKGHAANFGYPHAADVCSSLCRVCSELGPNHPMRSEMIDMHVNAVVAMVREKAKGYDNPKARRLAEHLMGVAEFVLSQAAGGHRSGADVAVAS